MMKNILSYLSEYILKISRLNSNWLLIFLIIILTTVNFVQKTLYKLLPLIPYLNRKIAFNKPLAWLATSGTPSLHLIGKMNFITSLQKFTSWLTDCVKGGENIISGANSMLKRCVVRGHAILCRYPLVFFHSLINLLMS